MHGGRSLIRVTTAMPSADIKYIFPFPIFRYNFSPFFSVPCLDGRFSRSHDPAVRIPCAVPVLHDRHPVNTREFRAFVAAPSSTRRARASRAHATSVRGNGIGGDLLASERNQSVARYPFVQSREFPFLSLYLCV